MKMKISLSSVFFNLRKGPKSVADDFSSAWKGKKNYLQAVFLFAFPEMKTSRKSVEALMVSMR